MHHSNLTEGMRPGDLADLVLPLLSVDEYVSKVDQDEAIVFGFYVHDKDAAADLNRFLQKTAVPIVDCEVSPAPDQHGYYMVFIELRKNARTAENIGNILGEIEGLVNIDEWQMRVRDHDDLIPFSSEALADILKGASERSNEHRILQFLAPSLLESAEIDSDLLVLHGAGERMVFEVIGFGRIEELLRQHRLDEAPITFDLRSIARTNRVARVLGENWQVMELNKVVLLHHSDDPRGLMLR